MCEPLHAGIQSRNDLRGDEQTALLGNGLARVVSSLNGGGRSLELHDHNQRHLALVGVGGLVAVDGHDLYVSGLCAGIGDDDGGGESVYFKHSKSCHIGNSFAYLAM